MSDSGLHDDGDTFRAFYLRWMPNLVGFIMLDGEQLCDAADIAQDTMVRAYMRWGEIEKPEAWTLKDAVDELSRRHRSSRGDADMAGIEGRLLLPSPIDLGEWASHHEILAIVGQLPDQQRQVMAWTLIGCSPAEIASRLGISAEVVQADLKTARLVVSIALSMKPSSGEDSDG